MKPPAIALLAALVLPAGAARADDLTDEEWLELAEEGEVITVWDERPEKPFDRDTEVRLTGEELAERGATDLATALALLPDVTVRDAGRGGFNLDIRGSRKGAVRVLIDGVAVSDPFYGTFDVSSIPITDIEEIRVSTAPASPIDGPGGPGGVIEVHTRDAIGPQLVIARLTADSTPVFGVSATGRVQHSKQLAVRLSASSTFGFSAYDVPDGEVDDERRATTGSVRVEHRDGARRWVVDGFADDRRYVSPPSDELATAVILLVDRETTGRVGVGFDDSLGADAKLQVQARGWIHAMKRLSRNFRDPELTDQASRESLFSMRAGGTALFTRPIGKRARWIAAATVDHERAGVVTSANGAPNTYTDGDATIVEASAGGQLEVGPIVADAAAGLAVPAGIDADPWPEGKLSVTYAHRYGSIEAIGARKGRIPSLRERFQGMGANVSLDPEQAWHGEVRATGRLRDGVELVVAPYVRRTTGTVKLGMDNLLVNLGELTVEGVDVSAKVELVDEVAFGGAYDFATARAPDQPPPQDEEPLDRFPHHKAEAWVRASPLAAVSVLLRWRYFGAAVDRSEEVDPYQQWEVTVTGQHDGWLGALRIDDLRDVAPETRAGYRQPGRVFTLTLQRTWD